MNSQPRRILVRGVNWLGDAVMTIPALLRLREKFPDAHITLLTPEKLRELWFQHAALNEMLSFTTSEDTFSVGNGLRGKKFDLALVLPNSPRSAIEVWLAGIPQRLGYARPWRNWFLTTRVAPRSEGVKMHKRPVSEIRKLVAAGAGARQTSDAHASTTNHQIFDYLHLVAATGANAEPLPPQLFLAADEPEAAKQKFGLGNITKAILGLNPGAEYGPAKRWPVERFIAAANEIQKQADCVWLIFGGKGDVRIAGKIQSAISHQQSVINLAGKTSLRELMSLLKVCRVLLTNDSGPMHVAAALGTPVVVPFGSTSPELTGPGLPGDSKHRLLRSDVPCSPCFLRKCPIDFRCMNGISVASVVETVLSTVSSQ
jgi:heptosyltransferase-2